MTERRSRVLGSLYGLSETLVKATIIVVALAAPGVINLFRRRRA